MYVSYNVKEFEINENLCVENTFKRCLFIVFQTVCNLMTYYFIDIKESIHKVYMLLLQTYLVISFLCGYRYMIKYIRTNINKLFTVYPININNINQTNCSKHILINNNDSINCVNSDSVNNNEQDQNFVEERKDNE